MIFCQAYKLEIFLGYRKAFTPKMSGTPVLIIFCIFFSALQLVSCFTVPMRLLLLAASDEDATTQLIKLALDARGIPYNAIVVPTGIFLLHYDISVLI